MNGTLRYRLGMAWRLWRTIPEVTIWDALKMLRYVPTSAEAIAASAAMAPLIAAEMRHASEFPLLRDFLKSQR